MLRLRQGLRDAGVPLDEESELYELLLSLDPERYRETIRSILPWSELPSPANGPKLFSWGHILNVLRSQDVLEAGMHEVSQSSGECALHVDAGVRKKRKRRCTCWKCGGSGHKAISCTIGEVSAASSYEVGGDVDARRGRSPKKRDCGVSEAEQPVMACPANDVAGVSDSIPPLQCSNSPIVAAAGGSVSGAGGADFHVGPFQAMVAQIACPVLQNDSLLNLHARVSHLEPSAMIIMFPELAASNFSDVQACRACRDSKQSSNTTAVRRSATAPGQILHAIVCHVRAPSLSNCKSFLLIIDEFTGYVKVAHLHAPYLCMQEIVKFLKLAKSAGNTVMTLRTDSEGLCSNLEFVEWCEGNGIELRFEPSLAHRKNHLVSLAKHEVVEGIRTLIKSACLSERFWVEAANHLCYSLNVLPRQRLGMKTPWEVFLHRKTPSILPFAFGATVSLANLGTKTSNRGASHQGLFLGPSVHGGVPSPRSFRVWDVERRRVQIMRDPRPWGSQPGEDGEEGDGRDGGDGASGPVGPAIGPAATNDAAGGSSRQPQPQPQPQQRGGPGTGLCPGAGQTQLQNQPQLQVQPDKSPPTQPPTTRPDFRETIRQLMSTKFAPQRRVAFASSKFDQQGGSKSGGGVRIGPRDYESGGARSAQKSALSVDEVCCMAGGDGATSDCNSLPNVLNCASCKIQSPAVCNKYSMSSSINEHDVAGVSSLESVVKLGEKVGKARKAVGIEEAAIGRTETIIALHAVVGRGAEVASMATQQECSISNKAPTPILETHADGAVADELDVDLLGFEELSAWHAQEVTFKGLCMQKGVVRREEAIGGPEFETLCATSSSASSIDSSSTAVKVERGEEAGDVDGASAAIVAAIKEEMEQRLERSSLTLGDCEVLCSGVPEHMASACEAESMRQIASTSIVTSSISDNSVSMAINDYLPPTAKKAECAEVTVEKCLVTSSSCFEPSTETEKAECDEMAAGERYVILSCSDDQLVEEVKKSRKAVVAAVLSCHGDQGAETYSGTSFSRLTNEEVFGKIATSATIGTSSNHVKYVQEWGEMTVTTTISILINKDQAADLQARALTWEKHYVWF
eukprot:TRINITY_DN4193_c0_g4_i1.p1 TRINITY_DN4193_c0_g4~~TRINITY_DN4193_c0_g4_i1.p1  ORF type:complete len:1085 (+),score=88.81 TRINITY_DN4193_c0_g4_i1:844-4098(+)